MQQQQTAGEYPQLLMVDAHPLSPGEYTGAL